VQLVQSDTIAARLLKEQLGLDVSPPFAGLVVVQDDQALGVAIFNGWCNGNVDMTAAGRGAFNVRIARDLARYAFHNLGVNRVTCHTALTNSKAIRALQAVGFRPEGVLRKYMNGQDAVVLGLLKDEQRLVKC
jgi:RimJ/RimL family protein N-acetyltransferase